MHALHLTFCGTFTVIMPTLKNTSCTLCRSAGNLLASFSGATESAASRQWLFRHTPGTRQFALFSEAPNNAKASVHCTLPASRFYHARKKRRNRHLTELSLEGCSLPFTCQLSNLCRGFPLVLNLYCETRAGQLVLSGAAFTRDAVELRQGPEASRNQLTYCGPHLTQTQLADLVIGALPLSSPLAQGVHEETLFFNSTCCFDNCAHNWYGHNPVHTVRPEVTEAVAQVASCFGVNDTLAAYVLEKALLVAKAERAAWLQAFRDTILKR